MTLEEIAETCGFASYSYFHRVFRANYGVSPVKFGKRQRCRQGRGRRRAHAKFFLLYNGVAKAAPAHPLRQELGCFALITRYVLDCFSGHSYNIAAPAVKQVRNKRRPLSGDCDSTPHLAVSTMYRSSHRKLATNHAAEANPINSSFFPCSYWKTRSIPLIRIKELAGQGTGIGQDHEYGRLKSVPMALSPSEVRKFGRLLLSGTTDQKNTNPTKIAAPEATMPPETAAAKARIKTIIWSFPLFRTCGTVLCG